jgi:Kef-type K+ transport system membrane component KefB
MIVVIPWALRFLSRHVIPYAPRSEFALLLIGAVICGYITKHLGVYYLVGAFLVGFIVGILRETLPGFHSEQIIGAVELFASLFIPFYFFHAGLEVPAEALKTEALVSGGLLVLLIVPVRVLLIAIARKWMLGEPLQASLRVAAPLLPTLVFTLVISGILFEQKMIDSSFYGALIFYTLCSSLLPQLALRMKPFCFASQALDNAGERDESV